MRTRTKPLSNSSKNPKTRPPTGQKSGRFVVDRNLSIKNLTRTEIPKLPLLRMKNEILGENYQLSLVFVGSKKIQNLNKHYRNKNKPTDILSFPLDKENGEIFICPGESAKKAKLRKMSSRDYLGFLFIHGLLHLKGLDHGSRMKSKEKAFCSFFGIKNI